MFLQKFHDRPNVSNGLRVIVLTNTHTSQADTAERLVGWCMVFNGTFSTKRLKYVVCGRPT